MSKINILFEDNHLLVVIKPINIPVQADNSQDDDFLNLLKSYLKEKYNKTGNIYLGLVHRLDRPVNGVMVFAKTSKAASRLSEQVRLNQLTKIYHAVVLGKLEKSEDHLVDYLLKDHKTNTTVISNSPKAKQSELDYKVIKTTNDLTLLEIHLQTGRSHQIRVQFSSRNHPLWGDQRYNKKAKIGEQIALCATKLEFYHPITKEKLSFEIEIPNRKPFNLFNK